jgi:hypothetical protein
MENPELQDLSGEELRQKWANEPPLFLVMHVPESKKKKKKKKPTQIDANILP